MYVYIHICVYVCMHHVCMCPSECVPVHLYTSTQMYINTQTTNIHTHISVCMQVYIQTYVCVCVHVDIKVSSYVHLCSCACIYSCQYMHTYVRIMHLHAYFCLGSPTITYILTHEGGCHVYVHLSVYMICFQVCTVKCLTFRSERYKCFVPSPVGMAKTYVHMILYACICIFMYTYVSIHWKTVEITAAALIVNFKY